MRIGNLQLVFSGYEKFNDPHPFEAAIQRHGVVDADIGRLAEILGFGEMLLGLSLAVALFAPRVATWAYVASAAVLSGFTAYLCVVWIQRGPVLDCGCSGILPLSVAGAAMRNTLYLGAVGWLLCRQFSSHHKRAFQ